MLAHACMASSWNPPLCAACSGAQAAECGQAGTLRLLLAAAPGMASVLSNAGDTPLALAAASGCPACTELLLDADAAQALVPNSAGHLPLAHALLRALGGWGERRFARWDRPCRSAADRVAVGRLLLQHGGPDEQLPVLAAAEPELSLPLFACLVGRWRLSAEQWALVPAGPVPGLASALPAVLARQDTLGAAQLVRRLGEEQRERLRHLSLCLGRAQQQLAVALPGPLQWAVLAAGFVT